MKKENPYHFNLKSISKWFKERNIGNDKLILIGLAGIVLVLCTMYKSPDKNKEKKNVEETTTGYEITRQQYTEYMENRLKSILEKIENIGSVKVMINYKSTWEKIVLTENPYTYNETKEEDKEGGKRIITEKTHDENVIYDSEDMPYVTKEIIPEIQGIAVIAQGENNPVTEEKIINVIKALFDVSVNKIAVVWNGG